MTKMLLLAGATILVAMVGCSSSEHEESGTSGGPHNEHNAGGGAGAAGTGAAGTSAAGTSAASGGTGAGGSGGVGGSQVPALVAPELGTLMPMQGALHVMWTNKQADCDTVEGERKTETEPYTMAFTVPGEADNKHDASANANTVYTYRLRCKKGDVYSDYSSEMSRNPKD